MKPVSTILLDQRAKGVDRYRWKGNAPSGLFGLHKITALGVFFRLFRSSITLASKASNVSGLAGSTSAGTSTPTIEALHRAETSASKPSLSHASHVNLTQESERDRMNAL